MAEAGTSSRETLSNEESLGVEGPVWPPIGPLTRSDLKRDSDHKRHHDERRNGTLGKVPRTGEEESWQ